MYRPFEQATKKRSAYCKRMVAAARIEAVVRKLVSGRLPSCDNRLDAVGDFSNQMHEVTQILSAIEQGDPHAPEKLLPLVYAALRRLAAQKLAQEVPGQTLQATALVHEVYLRLVDVEKVQHWDSRGHFFVAAAEAMRRILVESARSKGALKRGGGIRRLDLDQHTLTEEERSGDLLALDEALDELESHDAQASALVKLRYFAGQSHQEAADSLGISRRAADRLWALARAWLHQRIGES
jgi:RNA polymerase sigma factor (TIGR02999 family)